MTKLIKVSEPIIGQEEVKAVSRVLESGNYVSGSNVEIFEKEFANFIGVEYAAATNNGTSALFMSLEALGVKPEHEVIVPPLTFFSTITSVMYTGAKPIFADIDPETLNICPKSIESKITARTKCILPVHFLGQACDMNQINKLATAHDLFVLEDCAQSHGATFAGKTTGSIGHVGAFSFYATKNMTTGEGGMVTSNDGKIIDKLKKLRNHGMSGRDRHELLGFNNRMNEINASIGIEQLKKLKMMNDKRVNNSKFILEALKDSHWCKIPVKHDSVYFWAPILIKKEYGRQTVDKLRGVLTSKNIEFRYRYQEPLYRQPVYMEHMKGFQMPHLENAETVAGLFIGLPNHPNLSRDDLNRIVDVLVEFKPG